MFGGFFSDVWDDIKSVATTVYDTAKAVVKVISVLVTGSYSYGPKDLDSVSMAYNVDASGHQAKGNLEFDEHVQCTNCFFNFDADVWFELDISDYSLSRSYLIATGDLHLGVSGELRFEAEAIYSWTDLMGTIPVPSLTIDLGLVVLHIDTTIPVNAGYNATVTAESTLLANVSVSGSAMLGFNYTSDYGFEYVNSHSLSHVGTIPGLSQEASLTTYLWVMPTVVMNVDCLGGPSVSFRAFAEGNADYSSPSPCKPPASGMNGGFSTSLNMGLQISATAILELKIDGKVYLGPKTYGPFSVYNLKKPVLSGCISFETEEVGATDGGFSVQLGPPLVGEVWAGYQVTPNPLPPACTGGRRNVAGFDMGMHFQLVSSQPSYGEYDFFSSSTDMYMPTTGARCMSMALFQYVEDAGDDDGQFTPDTSSLWFSCDDSTQTMHILPFPAFMSKDYNTISSSGQCGKILLSRVGPRGAASQTVPRLPKPSQEKK